MVFYSFSSVSWLPSQSPILLPHLFATSLSRLLNTPSALFASYIITVPLFKRGWCRVREHNWLGIVRAYCAPTWLAPKPYFHKAFVVHPLPAKDSHGQRSNPILRQSTCLFPLITATLTLPLRNYVSLLPLLLFCRLNFPSFISCTVLLVPQTCRYTQPHTRPPVKRQANAAP